MIENALRDKVNCLCEERRNLARERDKLLDRGLFARIFNWR